MGAVLVTGGGGYLGTVLVPLLLEEEFPTVLFDAFHFGFEPILSFQGHPLLTVVREDISRQDRIAGLLKRIDTIVHLAGVSNDPSCDLDPSLSIRTNVLSTLALARRAKAAGVKRFLFASSCSVYGTGGDKPLEETSETNPVTLYALTKLAAERELFRLSSPDFCVTNLRFATLFGLSPRMRFDLAVNIMIKKALQNQDIVVHGDGKQYRPFIHVRDAARSVLAVLKAPADSAAGEEFNIGDHSLIFTIEHLAAEIAAHFPRIGIQRDPQCADIRSYRPDFSKFISRFQTRPERRVADAVPEIREAYLRGDLGSMEEEKFYNLRVLRRLQSSLSQSGLKVSHG